MKGFWGINIFFQLLLDDPFLKCLLIFVGWFGQDQELTNDGSAIGLAAGAAILKISEIK